MSLVIRAVLILDITDVLVFYAHMRTKDLLKPLFIFKVIVVTIVPLVLSLWFDIIYSEMI